ncbi:MAG: hypothetical protein E7323_04720 [Clostridiales bacterium]|nr:hypothetical protein [Clostridiales bacterium]
MQQKSKNINQPEVVVKPILTGSWKSAEAYRMAPKRTLSILLIAVVYVFFSVMAGFDQPVLRLIMSLATIGIVFFYQYTKGMEKGEKDAAYSEILYARKQEGRTIPKEEEERCFHPLRGAYATLLGALPFIIICLVYAFLAKPWAYQLGVLPGWMKAELAHNELGDALNYYQVTRSMNAEDILRIIVRCLTMPFINVGNVFGNQAVLWVERLSALFVLVGPMGFGVGYSRGHALRTRINTGIMQGVEKKKRKERKARRQRQRSSSPERLI